MVIDLDFFVFFVGKTILLLIVARLVPKFLTYWATSNADLVKLDLLLGVSLVFCDFEL